MTDEKDWNDIERERGAEGAREVFNEAIANREQGNSGPPPGDDDGKTKIPVLQSYFIEELARQPVEPVDWLVEDFIPANAVTGFFGDGGTGKDRTLLLLAAAVACDQRWLGKDVKHGRVLYFNVEDDDKELNRRQAAIADHYDLDFEKFPERLKIVPLVGQDTVLAVFNSRAGMVQPRPLFESVRRMVGEFEPTLTIVGNRVNIFSVDQNNDAQARQCLGLLTSLTKDFGTTVIMPGHVSLSGMSSGRGDSGTVQWSNGCRSRLLLDRVTKENGAEPDPDARVLQVKKANWGPDKNEIRLRWSRGLFVPDTEDIKSEKATWSFGDVATLLNDEDEFLRMLDLLKGARTPLSPWPTAHNNAPKIFAEDSRCKLTGKGVRDKLKSAMERLLTKGAIEIVEVGPPSKSRTDIRRVERGVVVDFPDGKPVREPPAGEGADQGAEPSAGIPFMITIAMKEELKRRKFTDEDIFAMRPERARAILADASRNATTERFRVIGKALVGDACLICFGTEDVKLIKDKRDADTEPKPLHLQCAKEWFDSNDTLPPD